MLFDCNNHKVTVLLTFLTLPSNSWWNIYLHVISTEDIRLWTGGCSARATGSWVFEVCPVSPLLPPACSHRHNTQRLPCVGLSHWSPCELWTGEVVSRSACSAQCAHSSMWKNTKQWGMRSTSWLLMEFTRMYLCKELAPEGQLRAGDQNRLCWWASPPCLLKVFSNSSFSSENYKLLLRGNMIMIISTYYPLTLDLSNCAFSLFKD